MEHPTPAWAKDIPQGSFISYLPSYVGGEYLDLFDEYTYPCKATGDITYYLYDPVKHGAKPGDYPLLVFLHGFTNALAGKTCVNYCGSELFASPKYQEAMGGAYILVPLANEVECDGNITGSWDRSYIAPVSKLIKQVKERHGCGGWFLMGGSLGGWFTWKMAESLDSGTVGIIPISADYVPSAAKLDRFAKNGLEVLFCCGRHDEFASFSDKIEPQIQRLESYANIICYFPEWVRNGDGGIASLFYGREMGQHCLINQIQANLVYDDGTPYDTRLPDGVTGWIKKVYAKRKG